MKTTVSLILPVLIAAAPVRAEKIAWYSDAAATNLTSYGQPMSGSFNFELGVFKGSFVPGESNKDQWVANWVPAQRAVYNGPNQRFAGQITVVNNTAPFTANKPAYVWGFQGGLASSEWILFRAPTWVWPVPNPIDPFGLDWNTAAASAVLGSVGATGSPFLMKSAAVSDVASPATTWAQWQAAELAGEPLNGPQDDPDGDGVVNLLEYVFGTPPVQAGSPPQTPVELVNASGQWFQQISIPRRADHPATLTVEVSPDLTEWASGPAATVVVSDTPAALVVRDLTPVEPGMPQRFMRLKAELATP